MVYLRPTRVRFLELIMIFAPGTVVLTGPFLTRLAIAFVFRYAQNIVMQIIEQNVMYNIRHQIFPHLSRPQPFQRLIVVQYNNMGIL